MLGTPLNRSAVALCRAGKRSQAPLDLEPSCHLNVCVYEAQALIERSGWVLFQHVQSAIFGAFRSAPLEQFLYQPARSEEHTSELQSLRHLVCRLLLEKKKKHIT